MCNSFHSSRPEDMDEAFIQVYRASVLGLPTSFFSTNTLPSINTVSGKEENTLLGIIIPNTIFDPHGHTSISSFIRSYPSSSLSPALRPFSPSSRPLMPNLPTSQTPNNHPTEIDSRIHNTSQDARDAVHDSHDAVTDGAEGRDELFVR